VITGCQICLDTDGILDTNKHSTYCINYIGAVLTWLSIRFDKVGSWLKWVIGFGVGTVTISMGGVCTFSDQYSMLLIPLTNLLDDTQGPLLRCSGEGRDCSSNC